MKIETKHKLQSNYNEAKGKLRTYRKLYESDDNLYSKDIYRDFINQFSLEICLIENFFKLENEKL